MIFFTAYALIIFLVVCQAILFCMYMEARGQLKLSQYRARIQKETQSLYHNKLEQFIKTIAKSTLEENMCFDDVIVNLYIVNDEFRCFLYYEDGGGYSLGVESANGLVESVETSLENRRGAWTS